MPCWIRVWCSGCVARALSPASLASRVPHSCRVLCGKGGDFDSVSTNEFEKDAQRNFAGGHVGDAMAKAIEEEEQKEESRDTPILIKTSTALLIVAIEPRLNSRREKFKNAVRLFQSDTDAPAELEEQLISIADKLDQLLSSKGQIP